MEQFRSSTGSLVEKYVKIAREKNSSDIHLKVGNVPYLRVDGFITPMTGEPTVTEDTVLTFLNEYAGLDGNAIMSSDRACDFSTTVGETRVRGNAFRDIHGLNVSLRLLTMAAMDFSALGVPETLKALAVRRSGMILVTGPTGSGKSTTLTSLIDHINSTQAAHIITIEDPIEYLHENKKSIISQRAVGTDTHSFCDAIVEALREDPDIILVGEMRDVESIQAAIRAAETGHLVLGTLHTRGSANAISRMVDAFPAAQQDQIRAQLSMSLMAVLSQQLLPGAVPGKRHLATELLVINDAVRNLIRQNKLHMIGSIMQTSRAEGMYPFSVSMEKLLREGLVSMETFKTYSAE